MDDLSGLDWNTTSAPVKGSTAGQANYYPTIRPTPSNSGTSTPAFAQGPSLSKPPAKSPLPSKPSTPANDSFANLVSFGGTQTAKYLSLKDKQRALQEQRTKQTWGDGGIGSTFEFPDQGPWSQIGGLQKTTNGIQSPPAYSGADHIGGTALSMAINKPFTTLAQTSSHRDTRPFPGGNSLPHDDDDLLAAFAADAPVDSSSNYPKPAATAYPEQGNVDEDDDPFGLGVSSQKRGTGHEQLNGASADEDDVLGLLARPVSELSARRPETLEIPSPVEESHEQSPLDKAIAELVDMGFSVEVSKDALESTSSGFDVQAAVSIILNQAHDASRHQTRSSTPKIQPDRQSRTRSTQRDDPDHNTAKPAWMRQQGGSASTPKREESRSPATRDKDAAKYAADLGNNLFKTANSLWKTGTKKLNQAVSEFNSDSDTSQPKWMRDASPRPRVDVPARELKPSSRTSTKGRPMTKPSTQNMTDEALLLEAPASRPQSRQRVQASANSSSKGPDTDAAHGKHIMSANRSSQRDSHSPQPFQPQTMNGDQRPKLNRQLIEEQSSQAYVSPARRKKQPSPQPVPQPAPEVDLLDTSKTPLADERSRRLEATPRQQPTQKTSLPKSSLTPRPRPPPREIPALSPSALQTSTLHRQAGTNLFKAGDYAPATTSYTTALASLPSRHPLASLIHTNRALTHLKTGDPKACIADADAAIAIIGPSRGLDEIIDLGNGEGNKLMVEIWGKAMTRRAEAMEQLEKWDEAAAAWRICVEAGVGGSTSIQGRTRCEKVAGKGNTMTPQRPADVRRGPSAPATSRPASSKPALRPPSLAVKQQSAEAVSRLRALNAAAERADNEKFALADSVSARIDGWRKGKETNLRALLGSLDAVLWDGSGWKKVGMSELIVPGKVKVAYMKGIAKVHPDKVSRVSLFCYLFPGSRRLFMRSRG